MKIFYLDSVNGSDDEVEITLDELSEIIDDLGDTTVELDNIDDDGNMHLEHTCYGMYY